MKKGTSSNLLLLFFFLSGCKCGYESGWDYRLQIKNESTKAIIMRFSYDSVPSFIDFEDKTYYVKEIKPDSVQSIWSKEKWDHRLTHSYNKKLNFYFFDNEILKKYSSIDSLLQNKLWIKEISLSKEELEQNNWLVVFKE